MWFTSCYPRSDEISQKSNKLDYILSESVEDKVRTIFDFSLCATPLWAILVIYFRRELKKFFRGLGPSESSVVCCC